MAICNLELPSVISDFSFRNIRLRRTFNLISTKISTTQLTHYSRTAPIAKPTMLQRAVRPQYTSRTLPQKHGTTIKVFPKPIMLTVVPSLVPPSPTTTKLRIGKRLPSNTIWDHLFTLFDLFFISKWSPG
jgi:hypothetical protein